MKNKRKKINSSKYNKIINKLTKIKKPVHEILISMLETASKYDIEDDKK